MKNTQEGDVVITLSGIKGVVEAVFNGMVFIKTTDDPNNLVVVYPIEIISNPMALQRIYDECPID